MTKEEPEAEQPKLEDPQRKDGSEEDEDERESQLHAQEVTKLSNETTLLRQDFMLDPEITVHEFLRQNDLTVIDFVRLERGAVSAVHSQSV